MNIKNHAQYTENDYKYLKAKGWTDVEIIKRWDEEREKGCVPCSWSNDIAQAKLAQMGI